MSEHRCPVRGCTIMVPVHRLMCLAHWKDVDRPLREEVYAAYNEQPGSPRHVAAVRAAIANVEAKC